MAKIYEAIGMTEDGETIVLETPLPVRGRVRVRVEIAPESRQKAPQYLWAFLEELHERQRARGHVPPTPEAVEAERS